MSKAVFKPLSDYRYFSLKEMHTRSKKYYQQMKTRRTVREYSSTPIPQEIIENCILTAGTAPNGANLQPWHFVVVKSPEIKKKIRDAAETEERAFYNDKAPKEWLDALEHLGTDENKSFLEEAPYLIVVMAESFAINSAGDKVKNYYVSESVGIATGLLISAVHNAGLVSLTHTPSPMKFLNDILERPSNEKPYLILVVGYPSDNVTVPVISKKKLKKISTFV